jgi:Spy/CpxP family protein refolding chaperone
MKFNLKTAALTSFAAIVLLSAPLGMINTAQAEGGRSGHRLEQLDLTDAQSTQIEAIHTNARAQMRSILTEEQIATLESSEGRRAWRALDLSDSQREQLRSIREASREEISAVLTEEQRAQVQSMREERHGRRGGNRR